MNPVFFLMAFCLFVVPVFAQQNDAVVLAKVVVTDEWKPFTTRTLADLPAEATNKSDSGLSRYGGLLAKKVTATGFFNKTNLDGRWWLIDPDGFLFIRKGVNDVAISHGKNSSVTLKEKFGDESNWVKQTTSFLRSEGFNSVGAWSDTEKLRQSDQPLVYTRILNFMSGYGDKRGGTYQQSGHMGYPSDCIFVFDPGFESFCDIHAQQLATTKNDPWLLGTFSDNELPFWRTDLKKYLQLPAQDPGNKVAWAWLRQRHGAQATIKQITDQDEKDFLAVVVSRYYRIVSSAIKKSDSNHLFLGSRVNGRVLNQPEVFKAAGPYVDVMSVNYYRDWTPSQEKLTAWGRETGKPILITEWYAKAMDSGMANLGGAGWVVKTQRDRGLFYQNFTLGLLESKACVGWDWFKYADNDPTNTKSDPSNRDSNKGLVNIHYEPYEPMVELMKSLNINAYSLISYFDSTGTQLPSKILPHAKGN